MSLMSEIPPLCNVGKDYHAKLDRVRNLRCLRKKLNSKCENYICQHQNPANRTQDKIDETELTGPIVKCNELTLRSLSRKEKKGTPVIRSETSDWQILFLIGKLKNKRQVSQKIIHHAGVFLGVVKIV